MSEQVNETVPAAPGGAAGGELVNESQWGAVRALFARGCARKQIARELGLDVKTVRKWLRQSWRPQRRLSRGRCLDKYEGFLRARASEVGYNAVVLHRELMGRGYTGSYAALARYVSPWRSAMRAEEESTVRFETDPGKQSQVDWGSCWVWLSAERVRVHLFVMVLGYSRRLYARGYRNEGLDCLLDGHERAFEHFGGRTEEILYDNPRTIVLSKDESSGQVEWNATFKDRMDFYGLTIRLCRYFRAQTKGKVESGVKYVKRNGLAGRRFRDLEELNAWLERWCLEVADQRCHGTTHERPAERFARAESAAMIATSERPATCRERWEMRVVPRDGMVSVLANRYQVPSSWSGHQVQVLVRSEEVVIVGTAGETVGHQRLSGKHGCSSLPGETPKVRRSERSAVAQGPPQLDLAYLGVAGEVAARSLVRYAELAEGGR